MPSADTTINANSLAGKKKNTKQARPAPRKQISAIWIAIVLGAIAFLVYAPSISNGYAMDDELVTRDHRLTSQGISAISEIFESYYYFDNAGNYYGYRPVVLASFAIEHDMFGEDPQIGHGINVLLYALTCMLIFLTLLRLTRVKSWWLPALATLIFALHPLHTEVVMSLKNRDELLGMLFVVMSLWACLKYIDKKQLGYILLGGGSFALAVLSIPSMAPFGLFVTMAVVLFRKPTKVELAYLAVPMAVLTGFFLPSEGMRIPVMLLFAAVPFGLFWLTGKWKHDGAVVPAFKSQKFVYIAMTFGLFVLSWTAIANYSRMERMRGYNLPVPSEQIRLRKTPGRRISRSENPLALGSSVSERLGTSAQVMGIYLKLHLLPYPLRYYYGYKQVEVVPMTNLWAIIALLIHIGLGILVLLYWRKFPLLAFGIAWYLAGILAASNLPLIMTGIVGERLVYPAGLGFAVAIAWLLVRFFKPDTATPGLSFKGLSPGFMGLLAVIVLAYSGIVILRAPAWESRYALFNSDMPRLEKSAKAHHLLATESVIQAMESPTPKPELVMQAHQHFMETVAIDPEFPLGWYDLGRLRMMMGDKNAALQAYEQSAVVDTFSAESYLDLAGLYSELGRDAEALEMLEKALEIDRGNLDLYAAISFEYFKAGNFEKAVALNEKALELYPGAFDPTSNIGKSYLAKGDTTQAITWFEKALPLNPSEAGLQQILKELYVATGDSVNAARY